MAEIQTMLTSRLIASSTRWNFPSSEIHRVEIATTTAGDRKGFLKAAFDT